MHKIFLVVLVLAGGWQLPVLGQSCMDDDGEEGLTVAGFIQSQLEYHQTRAEDELSFTFNRARIGCYGNVPYDVKYYIFLECSPFHQGAPYLLDAFISYTRLAPYASFTIGQFKSPGGLELNTSCKGLHTIKRSEAVNQLASPARGLGFMVTSKYKELVTCNIAIMNGTGAGAKDTLELHKDVVGRLVFSPLKYVSLGISGRFGKSKTETVGAEDDETQRLGGELQIEFDKILVQGEYIRGKDIGSYTTGGGCGGPLVVHQGTVDRHGFFVQGMYMTPWNLQPVLKYELYDPDITQDENRELTVTFGLNYFLNDWTRIQINYLYNAEEIEIENDQVLGQVQVEF